MSLRLLIGCMLGRPFAAESLGGELHQPLTKRKQDHVINHNKSCSARGSRNARDDGASIRSTKMGNA